MNITQQHIMWAMQVWREWAATDCGQPGVAGMDDQDAGFVHWQWKRAREGAVVVGLDKMRAAMLIMGMYPEEISMVVERALEYAEHPSVCEINIRWQLMWSEYLNALDNYRDLFKDDAAGWKTIVVQKLNTVEKAAFFRLSQGEVCLGWEKSAECRNERHDATIPF